MPFNEPKQLPDLVSLGLASHILQVQKFAHASSKRMLTGDANAFWSSL